MKIEHMTDRELVKLGLIEELSKRFTEKVFIVRRRFADGIETFVEFINTYDGDTEWTTDPNQARFFRGSEWAAFWASPNNDLLTPTAYLSEKEIPHEK